MIKPQQHKATSLLRAPSGIHLRTNKQGSVITWATTEGKTGNITEVWEYDWVCVCAVCSMGVNASWNVGSHLLCPLSKRQYCMLLCASQLCRNIVLSRPCWTNKSHGCISEELFKCPLLFSTPSSSRRQVPSTCMTNAQYKGIDPCTVHKLSHLGRLSLSLNANVPL